MGAMNNRGMSLVEIVVSMLILAVAALGVASTISLVNSAQMRSSGGGGLDLQAAGYARETLESLKNAVSTDVTATGSGRFLVDSDSTSTGGTVYIAATDPAFPAARINPGLAFPAGSAFASLTGAKRTYTVWDVDASTTPDGVTDYKKVRVCVAWPPSSCA